MRNHKQPSALQQTSLTEDDIRQYAYHLYERSGCVPGRDLENWLAAKAHLDTRLREGVADPARRARKRTKSSDSAKIITLHTYTSDLAQSAADAALKVQPAPV